MTSKSETKVADAVKSERNHAAELDEVTRRLTRLEALVAKLAPNEDWVKAVLGE